MDGPRFSVVMPVHDAAATIGESIASVRAQHCDDWELVLVDDRSTDDSVAEARSACAGMAQRLTVLSTQELAGSGTAALSTGPSAARNLGLARAQAPHVAFLDADDVWDPVYLTARADMIAQHPGVVMVFGPAIRWHPDRPERPDVVEGLDVPESLRTFEAPEIIRLWLYSLRSTPCPSATVVRREVAERVGGFPVELRRGEDLAAWMRLASAGPVLWDDRPLFRYRRHGASATSSSNRDGTQAADDLAFARWTARYVHEHDLVACRAVAARNLQNTAEVAAARLRPVAAQWATTRSFLGEAVGRRYWWWLSADWLLPRRLARRAIAVFHGWAGALTP